MRYRNILIQAIPVLILLLFTWLKTAPLLAGVTDSDPGLFEAFGYHLLQGKTLYADIWDHKPPLIFYLNFGFLKLLGTSEDAVSLGCMFFCLAQTLVFYFLLQKLFKNTITAFVGTCLFISNYFSATYFGSGNYSEQYGVFFTTSGFLFLLEYLNSKKTTHVWVSGILFGIAIWFKEPFLFSVVPVIVFLVYYGFRNKFDFGSLLRFVIAFFLPAFIICNIMALTGSWDGYKEQLTYSLQYAAKQQPTDLVFRIKFNLASFSGMFPFSHRVFAVVFAIGAGLMVYKKETRVAGILICGMQLMDYIATSVSGNGYFHYYLQSAPLSTLALLSAPILVGEYLKKYHLTLAFLPIGIVAILTLFLQRPWTQLAWDPNKKFDDNIQVYLNENEFFKPRFIAVASKEIGFYLLRAEGISELKYAVPYPYHWLPKKGKPKKYRITQNELAFKETLPDFVIYSGKFAEIYRDCGLDSFVLANYTEAAVTEMKPGSKAYLLRKRAVLPEALEQ